MPSGTETQKQNQPLYGSPDSVLLTTVHGAQPSSPPWPKPLPLSNDSDSWGKRLVGGYNKQLNSFNDGKEKATTLKEAGAMQWDGKKETISHFNGKETEKIETKATPTLFLGSGVIRNQHDSLTGDIRRVVVDIPGAKSFVRYTVWFTDKGKNAPQCWREEVQLTGDGVWRLDLNGTNYDFPPGELPVEAQYDIGGALKKYEAGQKEKK